MSETTKIEWCDATFNPWIGCTKVSPACDHCYAERSGPARTMGIAWGPKVPRHRTTPGNWALPLRWNAWADAFEAEHGRRRRVFCASLADVFDNEVPSLWRQHLMTLVADTPNLDWLFLTKRIGNAARMLSDASMHDGRLLTADDHYRPPSNLWIGATVCNQAEVDRDIPKLLDTPAAMRFLSIEPLLSDIRLGSFLQRSPSAAFVAGRVTREMPAWTRIGSTAVDWVIAGGESGPRARPMHPAWVRSLRDQCAAASVPFLFKQWGEWREPLEGEPYDTTMGRAQRVPAFIVAPTGTVHCFENDQTSSGGKAMLRVGKAAAGRLLDGTEHNGYPPEPQQ